MARISAGSLGAALGNPSQAMQGIASGGLTQAFATGPGTGRKLTLGLAMRFEVTIGGVPIGLWQSCSGLTADFRPEPVHVGGDPTGQYWLPGQMRYPELVLERAVSRDSAKLRHWLVEMARSGADGVGEAKRTTARIRLLDAGGDEVASWLCYGVRPSAWTGPRLAAGNHAVAVETLTLVHEGFLDELHGTPEMASLSFDGVSVEFPYNPGAISASLATDSWETSTQVDQGESSNTPLPEGLLLGMDRILLAGDNVAHDAQALLLFGRKQVNKNKTELPILTYSWGSTSVKAKLTYVSVQLTHFDAKGRPVRATARLILRTNKDSLYPLSRSSRPQKRKFADWRKEAEKANRDDPMRHNAWRKR